MQFSGRFHGETSLKLEDGVDRPFREGEPLTGEGALHRKEVIAVIGGWNRMCAYLGIIPLTCSGHAPTLSLTIT